jgi:2-methylcitrate dehydratase PrpD
LALAMTAPLLTRLVWTLARPVSESEGQRARLHLLDWLACVAGARQTEVAAAAHRAAPDVLERVAYLGNVLEMDDVHRRALLHPGPVIWPAALSAARETGGDMAMMLAGAVRGYEAMIAIGTMLDAHHYSLWHPTSTAGGPGAAAAAASIFGLDERQTVSALGHAASMAGGLWHMRHDDVMTKQLHVTRSALEGLWCARAARAGFTGPAAVLEGPQGLFAAMTQTPGPLLEPTDWRIGDVSFKPWAACRHAHPVIDCALELRARGALNPPFVIETYADALRFCDRPNPVTEVDAKFSLQHAVAVIADGREATPADFTPQAIASLAALRAEVTVREGAEFSLRYPRHFGARLNGLELIDTRGDPERPLDRGGLIAKLAMLVDWGGLPASEADRAAALVLHGDDVGGIIALLTDWSA